MKKTIVMFDFNSFSLSKCSISCQKTILNIGPKLPYLGIFGLELQKTKAVFKINILKFVKMQSFIKNKKNFKLRTKIYISTSNFLSAPSNL